jgi:hypothetical protein
MLRSLESCCALLTASTPQDQDATALMVCAMMDDFDTAAILLDSQATSLDAVNLVDETLLLVHSVSSL